jgi:hypothetical protein
VGEEEERATPIRPNVFNPMAHLLVQSSMFKVQSRTKPFSFF